MWCWLPVRGLTVWESIEEERLIAFQREQNHNGALARAGPPVITAEAEAQRRMGASWRGSCQRGKNNVSAAESQDCLTPRGLFVTGCWRCLVLGQKTRKKSRHLYLGVCTSAIIYEHVKCFSLSVLKKKKQLRGFHSIEIGWGRFRRHASKYRISPAASLSTLLLSSSSTSPPTNEQSVHKHKLNLPLMIALLARRGSVHSRRHATTSGQISWGEETLREPEMERQWEKKSSYIYSDLNNTLEKVMVLIPGRGHLFVYHRTSGPDLKRSCTD